MPANPAPHLTDWLIEIGLTETAGMGAAPIGWTTIAAWRAIAGVMIEPWEARLLRRLSVAYLAEGRKAESEHCPPPWQWKLTAQEREASDEALRAVLG
jgi:Na+-transporting NADH:ubiquinone oxidoreductase subunit NqrB